MEKKSIWGNINFSQTKEKSAYDLLSEQSGDLVKATSGILKMEVEAIDAFHSGLEKPVALYILYVVAPLIGNFRRKILTVVEYSEKGRFPVDIISHLNNDKEFKEIYSEDFIEKVEEILSAPLVKNSIENLYAMSVDISNKIEVPKDLKPHKK